MVLSECKKTVTLGKFSVLFATTNFHPKFCANVILLTKKRQILFGKINLANFCLSNMKHILKLMFPLNFECCNSFGIINNIK